MERLDNTALKALVGGDFASGICHISDQGFNTQAFITWDRPSGQPLSGLVLQGAGKELPLNGQVNNGLVNNASGPLANVTQPLPGSC